MVVFSEQSERCPYITFEGNTLTVKGRSYMNDAVDYYRPILKEISELNVESLHVVVEMEYFNTSSSKCLLELFKRVIRKQESGVKADIVWRYSSNAPEMQEVGEDYRDLLDGITFDIESID